MSDVLVIVVLIVGGLALILAELCTPAFGTLAVGALVCFVLAVYYTFGLSAVLGLVLIVALLIGLPIYLMYLIRIFPHTPLGNRLALWKLKAGSGTGTGVPEAEDHADLMGAEGVAASVLRPSGVVTIEGRRIIATAETGFLPAGTRVRVITSTGMNVVVVAIEKPSGHEE